MKIILFPTDFSANALHASQYAGMLAKCFDANIVLLNVNSISNISEYQMPNEINSLIKSNSEKAENDLRDFAVEFIKIADLPADRVSQMIEYGFPNEKIIETASTVQADMIVMGTKGANNLLDKWLGTHAQAVMKNANCPVWIIPLKAEIKQPKKIMYAADFKEDEVIATQKVLKITEPLDAFCKVIHVHDIFEPIEELTVKKQIMAINEEFSEENVFARNINRSDIIEGLETYMETFKPDVLALAVQEKSFLESFFNESVTKHFVHMAELPILTFRK